MTFACFGSLDMKVASVLVPSLLGLGAGRAQAVPIMFSMSGHGIYDNLVGSYTYDAATNTYGGVNIWSLDYYSSVLSNRPASSFRSVGAIGSVLSLTFSDPLPDAGGNIAFKRAS